MVLSISAGLVVLLNMQSKKEPEVKIVEVKTPVPQEMPTVDILVARQDLPVGSVVKPDSIDRKPWPAHLKLDQFVVTDGAGDADVQGLVVRSTFKAGEPIIRTKLSNPKDPNFLAASLEAGMRAVTVSVDAISSVAGFVLPGDRVDLLLNHAIAVGEVDLANPQAEAKKEDVVEVLVSNAKVIATDQRAVVEDASVPTIPSSVTLAVSAEDAQRIRLAEKSGTLSFVLRPIADGESTEVPVPPTTVADLSAIFPPSYYPVIYNQSSAYKPAVIDIFEGLEGGDTTSGVSTAENFRKAMDKRKESGHNLDGFSAKQDSQRSVTVVRGTEAKVMGVTRP